MTDDREEERILLVEDDASFRSALAEVLQANGYEVLPTPDAARALELLQSESVDAVVTDLVMPGIRGEALMAEVRSTFPQVPVIAVTAFGSVEGALEVTRAGAADYLTKPFRTASLLDSLRRVLDESRPRREQARVRRDLGVHLAELVGVSRPMLRLFDRICRVAPSPSPVLITGETGTGKELVARAVHRVSGRAAFVPVNCGALPEHLLEAEIFGHARGAYTGAERDREGLLESAAGGTLFLDEVAELPLPLQPKLLRAIDTGEVRRLGETGSRHVDVRIVAATHRDLESQVEAGEFRDDLYWRLHVLRLDVPPLRDRPADVPLLVESFLERLAKRNPAREIRVSPAAMAALVEHPWPGNVRELFNTLERAITLMDADVLDVDELPETIRRGARSVALTRSAAERELTLAELEREYIFEILRRTNGNKTRAAELLGMPRRTLYRRLEEYGDAQEA